MTTATDGTEANDLAAEALAESEDVSALRLLHDTRIGLQKFRIQVGNRIGAIERQADHADQPVPRIYELVRDTVEELEDKMNAAIAEELKMYPVWDLWLRHVKGVGPSLAGQMLAMLHEPTEEKGPSSWYKAAGLAPERQPDGQDRLPRRRKPRCPECGHDRFTKLEEGRACAECGNIVPEGYGRVSYYPALRKSLYNVGESFVRSGGYYRQKYEEYKAQLAELHRDDTNWPPVRVDRVARWKAVKLFLSHLWNKWCEAIGITPRPPYALEKLGHHTFYPPPEVPEKGKI